MESDQSEVDEATGDRRQVGRGSSEPVSSGPSPDALVVVGDVFEDLDLTRPARSLRVVDVEADVGVVRVVNVKTKKMTKIRIDRLKPRANGSHGYRRVFRPEEAPGG